jgi:dynein heavy chain 1
MANPPQAVKVALESICLLLGEQASDWRAIRGIIIRDNFISTIVNFQTENIRFVFLKNLLMSEASSKYHFEEASYSNPSHVHCSQSKVVVIAGY